MSGINAIGVLIFGRNVCTVFISSKMSEEIEQSSQNDSEIAENEEKEEIEAEKVEKPFEKRTYKTKFETAKESKQRAIDNFKRGVVDPEYKVVKMSNGKFRCYPRKEPLAPEPIKLNQIPENKRSSEITNNSTNTTNKHH